MKRKRAERSGNSGTLDSPSPTPAAWSRLFPTSFRSTASGFRTVCWVAGGLLGLVFVEGQLFPLFESHAFAITWLLAGAWISPLVISLFIPETASRRLEEIAPHRSGSS